MLAGDNAVEITNKRCPSDAMTRHFRGVFRRSPKTAWMQEVERLRRQSRGKLGVAPHALRNSLVNCTKFILERSTGPGNFLIISRSVLG